MIKEITPIILTYNEASNISRTLGQLSWANDIVIVDSGSNDDTKKIALAFPKVRFFVRQFDIHASQWNYALKETGIQTEWVLSLDADYVLTDGFIEELRNILPERECGGYRSKFVYCVFGRPLRASIYPPVTVLYRRRLASYVQDGHTQRVVVTGNICDLRSRILHDDRKSLARWLVSQDRYMELEAEKLVHPSSSSRSLLDRIRRVPIAAPLAVLMYCLIVKGLLLNGLPGLYYTLQRVLAEIILSLKLIQCDLGLKRREPSKE
jgi:glycosyltransferase involved in cell wall biosynthesis